jgi:hypothetical protein
MAENENNLLDPSAQTIEAMGYQHCSNAVALKLRYYRNGSQGHCRNGLIGCLNRHPAEKNVANDQAFSLSNERSEYDPLSAQTINEISLVPSAKRLFVDKADRGAIFKYFSSDDQIVLHA